MKKKTKKKILNGKKKTRTVFDVKVKMLKIIFKK